MSVGPAIRCEAVVDLAAVRHNVRLIRERIGTDVALMAVVKADGYGHGATPVARAALAAGADLLGVATLGEALGLRADGVIAPLVAWLWLPSAERQELTAAVLADVQIGISSLGHLADVLRAGEALDRPVAVHLKIDTGLGRNGVPPIDLVEMAGALSIALRAGAVRIAGVMSHLASADVPGDPSIQDQRQAFETAIGVLEDAGVPNATRHLANTAGALLDPGLRYDQVRIGIGLYGFDPFGGTAPEALPPLRPVMTLRACVALTKRVPAGQGVSYGLTYRTATETTLALVPLGYADGIPRSASGTAEVLLRGKRRRIAGRVAMDQFVVDCGDDEVEIGDEVLLFGPGDAGEPTATEWAAACGTIDYEIVTRIGPRTPRRHIDTESGTDGRHDAPPSGHS